MIEPLVLLVVGCLLGVSISWAALRRRRAPGQGTLGSNRNYAEDALKVLARLESAGEPLAARRVAHELGISQALTEHLLQACVSESWVCWEPGRKLAITDAGRRRGQELVRAHRLWERYLMDQVGMDLTDVHEIAEIREHATTTETAGAMDRALGHPAWDPHGDIIPDADKPVPKTPGHPLSDWPEGQPARIVHVEDEPSALLEQLIAMGMGPGMPVQVTSTEGSCTQVLCRDQLYPLAASAAERIHVVPLARQPVPLDSLEVGQRAEVIEVQAGGRHQRRLLDLGLVPGAEVEMIRSAPLGDPVQYRVKGTAVSIRRADAASILVQLLESPPASRAAPRARSFTAEDTEVAC